MNLKQRIHDIAIWVAERTNVHKGMQVLYVTSEWQAITARQAAQHREIGRIMQDLAALPSPPSLRHLSPEEAEKLIQEQPGEAVRNVHWGAPENKRYPWARDIAPYPHCDPDVLHEPGACWLCDQYPDMQEHRVSEEIAFTGEKSHWKWPCPSTKRRTLEVIEQWPGNRASPYNEKI